MKTMAVMRPSRRLSESVEMVESMGYRVLAAPSLDIIHGNPDDFRKVASKLGEGIVDIAVFVSPTSVEEFKTALGDFSRLLEGVKVVSIGTGTTASLKKMGLSPDAMAGEFTSSGLVDLLKGSVRGKKVLVVHSDKGSPVLIDGLVADGAEVIDLIAYRLVPAADDGRINSIMEEGSKGRVDAFLFTSPFSSETFFDSAVSALGEAGAMNMLKSSVVAAIGDPTSQRLESLGVRVDVVPPRATFGDLLEAVSKKIGK